MAAPKATAFRVRHRKDRQRPLFHLAGDTARLHDVPTIVATFHARLAGLEPAHPWLRRETTARVVNPRLSN